MRVVLLIVAMFCGLSADCLAQSADEVLRPQWLQLDDVRQFVEDAGRDDFQDRLKNAATSSEASERVQAMKWLMLLGRPGDALRIYRSDSQASDLPVAAHELAAHAARRLGDQRQAIGIIRSVLDNFEEAGMPLRKDHVKWGTIWLAELNEPDRAEQFFNQYWPDDVNAARPTIVLAQQLALGGRIEMAAAKAKTISAAAAHPELAEDVAWLLLLAGKYDDAWPLWKLALQQADSEIRREDLRDALDHSFFRSAQLSEAIGYWEHVAAADPDDESASRRLEFFRDLSGTLPLPPRQVSDEVRAAVKLAAATDENNVETPRTIGSRMKTWCEYLHYGVRLQTPLAFFEEEASSGIGLPKTFDTDPTHVAAWFAWRGSEDIAAWILWHELADKRDDPLVREWQDQIDSVLRRQQRTFLMEALLRQPNAVPHNHRLAIVRWLDDHDRPIDSIILMNRLAEDATGPADLRLHSKLLGEVRLFAQKLRAAERALIQFPEAEQLDYWIRNLAWVEAPRYQPQLVDELLSGPAGVRQLRNWLRSTSSSKLTTDIVEAYFKAAPDDLRTRQRVAEAWVSSDRWQSAWRLAKDVAERQAKVNSYEFEIDAGIDFWDVQSVVRPGGDSTLKNLQRLNDSVFHAIRHRSSRSVGADVPTRDPLMYRALPLAIAIAVKYTPDIDCPDEIEQYLREVRERTDGDDLWSAFALAYLENDDATALQHLRALLDRKQLRAAVVAQAWPLVDSDDFRTMLADARAIRRTAAEEWLKDPVGPDDADVPLSMVQLVRDVFGVPQPLEDAATQIPQPIAESDDPLRDLQKELAVDADLLLAQSASPPLAAIDAFLASHRGTNPVQAGLQLLKSLVDRQADAVLLTGLTPRPSKMEMRDGRFLQTTCCSVTRGCETTFIPLTNLIGDSLLQSLWLTDQMERERLPNFGLFLPSPKQKFGGERLYDFLQRAIEESRGQPQSAIWTALQSVLHVWRDQPERALNLLPESVAEDEWNTPWKFSLVCLRAEILLKLGRRAEAIKILTNPSTAAQAAYAELIVVRTTRKEDYSNPELSQRCGFGAERCQVLQIDWDEITKYSRSEPLENQFAKRINSGVNELRKWESHWDVPHETAIAEWQKYPKSEWLLDIVGYLHVTGEYDNIHEYRQLDLAAKGRRRPRATLRHKSTSMWHSAADEQAPAWMATFQTYPLIALRELDWNSTVSRIIDAKYSPQVAERLLELPPDTKLKNHDALLRMADELLKSDLNRELGQRFQRRLLNQLTPETLLQIASENPLYPITQRDMVPRLLELFPARMWHGPRSRCDKPYLSASSVDRGSGLSMSWIDALLDDPDLMQDYSPLVERLTSSNDLLSMEQLSTEDQCVNAVVLSLVRIRQQDFVEAARLATLVSNADSHMLSVRSREQVAERWIRFPELQDSAARLVIPVVLQATSLSRLQRWEPLVVQAGLIEQSDPRLVRMKRAISDQAVANSEAVLASESDDDDVWETENGVSKAVSTLQACGYVDEALSYLLKALTRPKFIRQQSIIADVGFASDWRETELDSLTRKMQAQNGDQAGARVIVNHYAPTDPLQTGLLPLVGTGGGVSDGVFLPFEDAERANFDAALLQELDGIIADNERSFLQRHYAAITATVITMKNGPREDSVARLTALLDDPEFQRQADALNGIGAALDTEQAIQDVRCTMLPLWHLVHEAHQDQTSDQPQLAPNRRYPGIRKATEFALLTARQTSLDVYRSMLIELKDAANWHRDEYEFLVNQLRVKAPITKDAILPPFAISDAYYSSCPQNAGTLQLIGAVVDENDPIKQRRALRSLLFEFAEPSDLMLPDNTRRTDYPLAKLEQHWRRMDGDVQSLRKLTFQTLLAIDHDSGCLLGGRVKYVWPQLHLEESQSAMTPPTASSLLYDVIERELAETGREDVEAALLATRTDATPWQQPILRMLLAESLDDRVSWQAAANGLLTRLPPASDDDSHRAIAEQLFAISSRGRMTEQSRRLQLAHYNFAKNAEADSYDDDWLEYYRFLAYEVALQTGDAARIEDEEHRLLASLCDRDDSPACGESYSGRVLPLLARMALEGQRFASAGQMLASAMPRRRQAAQWRSWQWFTNQLKSEKPTDVYKFHAAFCLAQRTEDDVARLRNWFWDPADPNSDGRCSPEPEPVKVDVFPKTVAMAWWQLLESAQAAEQLVDLKLQVQKIATTAADQSDKQRAARLLQLVNCWNGDNEAVRTLLEQLTSAGPGKDLDYVTITLLLKKPSTNPAARSLLLTWASKAGSNRDIHSSTNATARLHRLLTWFADREEGDGLATTKWRVRWPARDIVESETEDTGRYRWSAQNDTNLQRNWGLKDELLFQPIASDAEFDFTVQLDKTESPAAIKFVFGDLIIGIDHEIPARNATYSRRQLLMRHRRWYVTAYHKKTLIAETALIDRPASTDIRLTRSNRTIRFECGGQELLTLTEQLADGIKTISDRPRVGLIFSSGQATTINNLQLNLTGKAKPANQLKASPVPHPGYRGVVRTVSKNDEVSQ